MNSSSNLAGVLCHLRLQIAAALLGLKAILIDCSKDCIALGIDSLINAIALGKIIIPKLAHTALKTTDAVVQLVEIKASCNILLSCWCRHSPVHPKAAKAAGKEQQEDYNPPCTVAAANTAIIVAINKAT